MNLKVKIQVTTIDQYNMIDDLINDDYSRYPFLEEVRENIESNQFLGQSSPVGDIISLSKVTHSIRSLYRDDLGILYADIKILDTPEGNILKPLVEEYEMILVPVYKVNGTGIIDFISLSIEVEIFIENDIYKRIIRNNKIDSLLK